MDKANWIKFKKQNIKKSINIVVVLCRRLDCVKMWRQFEDAVVLQSSCNVTVDYLPIFYTVPQSGPCHRVRTV